MYSILIADDEPIERMVVRKHIEKYFSDTLQVVEAVNGREAVEKCRENNSKIALLDIEMPGINGLEAAEQIRKNCQNTEIIFLTAFDEFSYAKKAISVKALDYLLKPVDTGELIGVLEEAIYLTEKRRIAGNQADFLEKQNGEKKEKNPDRGTVRIQAVRKQMKEYLEENFDRDISMQDAAEAMGYSDAYFCKLFKQCFDKSFTDYLTRYRIEKATEFLQDIKINIKEVGSKAGYGDANYFAKVFRRIQGMTPSEYRATIMAGDKKA